MESFLKKVLDNKEDEEAHRYFVRFGKGQYRRRFLIKLEKGKDKIKIRTSFEFANDLVKFVREISKESKFSGKVLAKNKISGIEGKKKAGVFVYEIVEAGIDNFTEVYFYLLDSKNADLELKIKKALPKPGKDAEKIDDKFCSLDLNLKYWQNVKDKFAWDIGDFKKAIIEHDLIINEIEIPKGESDPVKMREAARRKGNIIRRITADGKETRKELKLNG